jgi:hypothetical protein
MSHEKHLTGTAKVTAILAGVLVVCGLAWAAWYRFTRVELAPDIRVHRETPEFPEDVALARKSASKSVRDHLLDGDFRVVNQIEAVPVPWGAVFDSSFSFPGGTGSRRNKVGMADPGQPFQASDSLRPGLPFRRLIFAGFNAERAFIYYQHGGRMYPSYCLAVMDGDTKGMVWVGEARKEARNLGELRIMVSQGLFDDSPGPGC